jgi:S-adenosylmethionine synthetase
MGRPPKLTPHQKQEALRRREAGESLSDIARTYGVAHTTIARLTVWHVNPTGKFAIGGPDGDFVA